MANEGSLIRKINYAIDHKEELCDALDIEGNPTWDTIINKELENKLEISKYVDLGWVPTPSMPQGNNKNPTDNICYAKDKVFFIGTTGYYTFQWDWASTRWLLGSIQPGRNRGAIGYWNDGNGDLHYLDTMKYLYENDEWVNESGITLNGFNITNAYPRCFWQDYGGNTHYDYGSVHYVYNDDTKIWSSVTWNISIQAGDFIWTDGTTIYYSNSSNQYYLDRDTNTWIVKTWSSSSAISSFSGKHIGYIPVYRCGSTNKNTIPYLATSGKFYKFDIQLGYWQPYKFIDALPSSMSAIFWYWKEANNVNLFYLNNNTYTGFRSWYPIRDNWEDILISLKASIDGLMRS